MAKTLPVPKHVYRLLKEAATGERVEALIHLHHGLAGTFDVIGGSRAKPIKCKLMRADPTENDKRLVFNPSTAVYLIKL